MAFVICRFTFHRSFVCQRGLTGWNDALDKKVGFFSVILARKPSFSRVTKCRDLETTQPKERCRGYHSIPNLWYGTTTILVCFSHETLRHTNSCDKQTNRLNFYRCFAGVCKTINTIIACTPLPLYSYALCTLRIESKKLKKESLSIPGSMSSTLRTCCT